MAGSFVAYASAHNAARETVTVNKPTGTADNDILIAIITSGSSKAITGIPSGWSEIAQSATGCYAGIFWKRASSEGSSYTWTFSANSWASGIIGAFRGFKASGSPIHQFSNTAYNTSNTTIRAAGVTTTVPTWLLFLGSTQWPYHNMDITEPSGFTERFHHYDATCYTDSIMDTKEYLTPGATGNIDGTLAVTSTAKCAFLIALELADSAETRTKTFTIDGLIEEHITQTFTIDGIVKVVNVEQITIDGIIKEIKTHALDLDGVIVDRRYETFTVDGLVEIITSKTFTIDGYVSAGTQKQFTIDGYIYATELNKTGLTGTAEWKSLKGKAIWKDLTLTVEWEELYGKTTWKEITGSAIWKDLIGKANW